MATKVNSSSKELHLTGLEPDDLAQITGVFERNPLVESVVLFGSRAMGKHHSGSDIDLAVKGKQLDFNTLAQFRQELEALHLPWFFDLIHYDTLKDLDVKDHIDRVGVKVWGR